MLTIKIEENYADAIAQMGIKADKDALVMTVKDGETLMGVGVMHLRENYAVIDHIALKEEFKEFTLEYGLGKSLLNVVDLRGIPYAVSDNLSLEKQLRALKFKSPGEAKDEDFPEELNSWKLCLDLKGYFLAKC